MASTPEQVVCTPTFVFPAAFPGAVANAVRARGTQNTGIEICEQLQMNSVVPSTLTEYKDNHSYIRPGIPSSHSPNSTQLYLPSRPLSTPTHSYRGFDPRSHLANFHHNTGTTATPPPPQLQPQEETQKPKISNAANRGSGVKTHTLLANNDYATSNRNFLVATTIVPTTAAFAGVDPTKVVSAAAAQAAAIVAAVEKQDDMKDKLWPCPACKVPFKTASELQAHLSHHTKGERTVPCEVCGKLFVSAERVRVHVRAAHGEKSCSCDICGSGFSYRCKLLDHMRTHTGDKPFHCDVCGKSFSQKNHLTRHSMIHTGERPYPCDFCGRGFYRKDKLSRHRRIHTAPSSSGRQPRALGPSSSLIIPSSSLTIPSSSLTIPSSSMTIPSSSMTIPSSSLTIPSSSPSNTNAKLSQLSPSHSPSPSTNHVELNLQHTPNPFRASPYKPDWQGPPPGVH
ncbi:zinc finger protein 45-like isoform X2 [Limulus polyphemus]|uniref:Zinc finger protein 45-like isoform X2 n=1 Tax=Limulus polyphemus TaxID=6850 RepID=A0ABM1RVW5_LIMPO|nr:zinc finger protein 45-like isoform X2 [Limulus polyphemus]